MRPVSTHARRGPGRPHNHAGGAPDLSGRCILAQESPEMFLGFYGFRPAAYRTIRIPQTEVWQRGDCTGRKLRIWCVGTVRGGRRPPFQGILSDRTPVGRRRNMRMQLAGVATALVPAISGRSAHRLHPRGLHLGPRQRDRHPHHGRQARRHHVHRDTHPPADRPQLHARCRRVGMTRGRDSRKCL